jgi:Txe/YoeB family toxin of Txe-Axe toxin-antitoxin module
MLEPAATYRIEITRRAMTDITTLTPKLKRKLKEILLNRIAVAPHRGKKLVGELAGLWSVRLTRRDRVVYRIDEVAKVVFVLRARTHYDI